jgi:hypothetical protein
MIVSTRKFRSLVLLVVTLLLNSAAITTLLALEVDDDDGECLADSEGSCGNADATTTVSMAANINNVEQLIENKESVKIVIRDSNDDTDDNDGHVGEEEDFSDSDIEQEILNQLTKMKLDGIKESFKVTTKVSCRDGEADCIFWAKYGECKSNPTFMISE